MTLNSALESHLWSRSGKYARNHAEADVARSIGFLLKLAMLIIAIIYVGNGRLAAAQGCTPAPPSCPCYNPPKDPLAGTNFSNVDVGVISQHEGGNKLNGYTLSPTKWPNAGVTVGIGVDLGQQSAQGLRNMGVSQALVDKLSGYLGLTGTDAQNYLSAHPLTLTADEASELNGDVLKGYFNDLGSHFDDSAPNFNLSDLPWQAQTVMADLWYNMGDLTKKAPNLWDQMTNGDWNAAYDNLMNFTSKDDVLKNRAQSDAALLKQAMDACTLPQ